MLSSWLFATLLSHLLIVIDTASLFECSGQSQCSYNEFTCDPNRDCSIICNGPNACDRAIFNCPASANQCNVICNRTNAADSLFGCAYFTVDASQSIGGSLTVTAENKIQIMEGSTIKCPPNGSCNINCHAENGCFATTIISHSQTKTLSIVASGNHVLGNSNITCPNNINYGDCSISVNGDYINMITCINIYAQNSFNDLYIQCDHNKDINTNCYESQCPPIIHCGADHSGSCPMQLIPNTISKWQCLSSSSSSNNDCSVTSNPTINPTQLPTQKTLSPSISLSFNPSPYPTPYPSPYPSNIPSSYPSNIPSFPPSPSPTFNPTSIPTKSPTISPSKSPTKSPTIYLSQSIGSTTHEFVSTKTTLYSLSSSTETIQATKRNDTEETIFIISPSDSTSSRDGEVLGTTTTTIDIMTVSSDTKSTMDEIKAFITYNALWIIIIVTSTCCFLCCILVLTCCHFRYHRNRRSKISHQIKMERVKGKSDTALDALDYDEYDGDFDTTKHIPLPNTNNIDDDDDSDSESYDIDNDTLQRNKPKFNNVPSESVALQFEMTNSISIGIAFNETDNHKPENTQDIDDENNMLCIDQQKMGHLRGLSEGNEGGNINNNDKEHRYSFLFTSDDDAGSVEEMYDGKNNETLGGIDENYDEEAEKELIEGNMNVVHGGLPKLDDHDEVNSDDQVLVETNTNRQETEQITLNERELETNNITTDLDKYPSLPPEFVEDNRTEVN